EFVVAPDGRDRVQDWDDARVRSRRETDHRQRSHEQTLHGSPPRSLFAFGSASSMAVAAASTTSSRARGAVSALVRREQMLAHVVRDGYRTDHHGPDLVETDARGAPHGGSREHAVDPRIEVGIRRFVRVAEAEHLDPGDAGDVRDRVLVDEVLAPLELV